MTEVTKRPEYQYIKLHTWMALLQRFITSQISHILSTYLIILIVWYKRNAGLNYKYYDTAWHCCICCCQAGLGSKSVYNNLLSSESIKMKSKAHVQF